MTEVIVASTISSALGLMIGYFFKRWNREYITKKVCDGLRDSCKHALEKDDGKFNEFKKEMRDSLGIIKGLLLVLASGEKVSADDLKELMK